MSYNDYKMNKGIARNKILEKIFGSNCDYLKMFKKANSRMFMDDEKPNFTLASEYIVNGIQEFIEKNGKQIIDVFNDRKVLKELIKYLKEDCGIMYVYIRKYFEISCATMNRLKI